METPYVRLSDQGWVPKKELHSVPPIVLDPIPTHGPLVRKVCIRKAVSLETDFEVKAQLLQVYDRMKRNGRYGCFWNPQLGHSVEQIAYAIASAFVVEHPETGLLLWEGKCEYLYTHAACADHTTKE